MGSERTEAKKRERDRLKNGRDALRERLTGIVGRLSVRFGGPEYVRPPKADNGAYRFIRVIRSAKGGIVAHSDTRASLDMTDDMIVAKVVRESTGKLRQLQRSPKCDERVGVAIEHSLSKQMQEAHEA
jgi:hypothetical protein